MDRVDYYSELLPQYLRGDNIRGHCNVIERMTKKLYSQIQLLHDWNVLDRPILIEWIKEPSSVYATYNVHIKTHNPIKRIRISGGYGHVEEHPVDMMVTSATVTFTKQDDIHFRVEVETYNDITYVKEYPENDTIMSDDADHDLYLDIVGRFLSVPRKQYVEYPVDEGSNANPPYFGKSKYFRNWEHYYAACTEDDYVYANRLKQFIEDKKTDILSAHVKARYDKTVVVNTGDKIYLEDLEQTFPDFVEEHQITQEWLDDNKYGLYTVYVSNNEVPANYKHSFSNDEIYMDINRFLPCTRLALCTQMKEVDFTYNIVDVQTGLGIHANRNDATLKFSFGHWKYLDFTYSVDGVEVTTHANSDGEYAVILSATGVRKKTYQITVTSDGSHGEDPLDESFEVTVIWYDIDKYRYASHDEVDYTYSSNMTPSDVIQEGYSGIAEENYYVD